MHFRNYIELTRCYCECNRQCLINIVMTHKYARLLLISINHALYNPIIISNHQTYIKRRNH